jgi:hypothetical protein
MIETRRNHPAVLQDLGGGYLTNCTTGRHEWAV